MNFEFFIISIIIFLSVLSIIFSIINWVQLASTTAKISLLESEIEKKIKEFDTFKKERLFLLQQSPSDTTLKSENAPEELQTQFFKGSEAPPIQIMRNLRPGFQESEDNTESKHKVVYISEEPDSAFSPREMPQTADVLDVVDDNDKTPQYPTMDSLIEIPLFSAVKNDTDFSNAWKTLSAQLPLTPSTRVALDFKNVMFLYEKELRYLEKISAIVKKEGGAIEFVNCHAELRSIISAYPELACFIQ